MFQLPRHDCFAVEVRDLFDLQSTCPPVNTPLFVMAGIIYLLALSKIDCLDPKAISFFDL